jgi:MoxR-like ATPase
MKLSRAVAALEGRSFVTPDDVKTAAVPVLAHRLLLRPEHWGGRISTHSIVRSLLDRIPTPAVEMS